MFLANIGRCAYAALLVSSGDLNAAPPTIPADVKENLRKRVEYGYVTGVVVGLVNDEGRTFFGAGATEAGGNITPHAKTIFEIGSVTKAFTGTLLAQMVVDGEVALERPVEELLPTGTKVPEGLRKITLRDLATHRSGLPDNPANICGRSLNDLYNCYSLELLFEFLADYTLPFDPGERFSYSNVGAGLLGDALAFHAQSTYEDLLRERVLGPLHLNDTCIVLTDEQRSRRAAGHWGVVPWGEFSMPGLEGAGALHSTTDDLLTFLEHISGLKTGVLDRAATEATRRHGDGGPGFQMGLGWLLIRLPSAEIVGHDGSTYAQNCFVGFHREKRLGVAVLCNNRVSTYGSVQDVGYHLLDATFPLTDPAPPIAINPSELSIHEGRYRAPNGLVFDVEVRLGKLTLDFVPDGSPAFTIHPVSKGLFHATEIGLQGAASFHHSLTNHTLIWSQNGQSMKFERIAMRPALTIRAVPGGQAILQLRGTNGFEYEIASSADLVSWNTPILARREEWAVLTDPREKRGFYRIRLPRLE